MKCKVCQENKKKKRDEKDKKRLVGMYFNDWIRFMFILFLSVSIYSILTFVASADPLLLTNSFRFSLLVIILITWFYILHISSKIKFGCLHAASIMLWVAPILEFKEPVTFVVFTFLAISLFFLFIDITLGIIFKVSVKPIERTWCANRQQPRRNIKSKRTGGKK